MVDPAPMKTIFLLILRYYYCFTEPRVRPAMKCFCIRKNIATGGIAAIKDAADTKCQLLTYCPFKDLTPAVIGLTLSPCVNTVAQKKSFHTKVKIRTDKAASAGLTKGTTINKNILISPTPSIRPLSISSKGSALIKFLMKKVQNPV